MIKLLADSLLSVTYPQRCNVCSGELRGFQSSVSCQECWDETSRLTGSEMLCGRCGAVLGEKASPGPVFCRKCDDYHFDRSLAAGVFERALAAEIIALKSSPKLTQALRAFLTEFLRENCDRMTADIIVPVPLSSLRKIERGHNQAEVIAGEVSLFLKIPVDSMSLVRVVHTPKHRLGMDQKARELTVNKAFKVIRPALISGKAVLLVDDVLTTGATASACAGALKKAGAGRVTVFSLARAVLN